MKAHNKRDALAVVEQRCRDVLDLAWATGPTNLAACIFPPLPLVCHMGFRDIVDPSVPPARHSVTSAASAGDAITTDSRVIEVRVTELRQLFNAIDPSPFRERDLDPRAEEFIVEWARDLPRGASLALRVHLERCAGRADEAALLGQAVHQYFEARAAGSRRTLRELFRRGRISLLIGLAFLSASLALGDLIGRSGDSGFAALLREGLLIGGWVAMWRPLEVFLYDWWPILGEVRLLDRLSRMPVAIEYKKTVSDDSWRSDWPAVHRQADAVAATRIRDKSIRQET